MLALNTSPECSAEQQTQRQTVLADDQLLQSDAATAAYNRARHVCKQGSHHRRIAQFEESQFAERAVALCESHTRKSGLHRRAASSIRRHRANSRHSKELPADEQRAGSLDLVDFAFLVARARSSAVLFDPVRLHPPHTCKPSSDMRH